MRKIWTGTLARGGNVAEEFNAEVWEDDAGTLSIIEAPMPLVRVSVSVHEVRNDYLLRALADAMRGKVA